QIPGASPESGENVFLTEEILRVFFARPAHAVLRLGNGSNPAAIEQQTDLRPLFRRHALMPQIRRVSPRRTVALRD
ncbi:hypothetical protein, partial [Winogradskya consettensis]|uniref:hypothetical protein n=1 Tax=Winogradskya consettensis TaxID=113560 RepID=UPI001BB3D791